MNITKNILDNKKEESTPCNYATKYGHLDCLIYAHENGCPWNKNTPEQAAHCTIKYTNIDASSPIVIII